MSHLKEINGIDEWKVHKHLHKLIDDYQIYLDMTIDLENQPKLKSENLVRHFSKYSDKNEFTDIKNLNIIYHYKTREYDKGIYALVCLIKIKQICMN